MSWLIIGLVAFVIDKATKECAVQICFGHQIHVFLRPDLASRRILLLVVPWLPTGCLLFNTWFGHQQVVLYLGLATSRIPYVVMYLD
jgi:hypothetical protein